MSARCTLHRVLAVAADQDNGGWNLHTLAFS
jgi:hypothetical protein